MITKLNEFKNKINEDYHGSTYEPEILHDGEAQIANYTGVEVKKNAKDKWAAFPKVGDKIFAAIDRHGFSSSNLMHVEVVELDYTNKVIICDNNGVELAVRFRFSDAGQGHGDMIAYFAVVD